MSKINFAIRISHNNNYTTECITNNMLKRFVSAINSSKFLRTDFIAMLPNLLQSDVRNLKVTVDGKPANINLLLNKDVDYSCISTLDRDIYLLILENVNTVAKDPNMTKKIKDIERVIKNVESFDSSISKANKDRLETLQTDTTLIRNKIELKGGSDLINNLLSLVLMLILAYFVLKCFGNSSVTAEAIVEPVEVVRSIEKVRAELLSEAPEIRDNRRSPYKLVVDIAGPNPQHLVLKISGNTNYFSSYEHEGLVYRRFRTIQRDKQGQDDPVHSVAKFYGAGYTPEVGNSIANNFAVRLDFDKDGVQYINEPVLLEKDRFLQEHYNNGVTSFYYLTNEFDTQYLAFDNQYKRYTKNTRNPRLRQWLSNAYKAVTLLVGELNYLYGFYHGDLHDSNVLVTEDGTRAKMFDFDFSGFLSTYETNNRVRMPSIISQSFLVYGDGVKVDNIRNWDSRVYNLLTQDTQLHRNFLYYFDSNRLLQAIFNNFIDTVYSDPFFSDLLTTPLVNKKGRLSRSEQDTYFNRNASDIIDGFKNLATNVLRCRQPTSVNSYIDCIDRAYRITEADNFDYFNSFFASISVNNYVFENLTDNSIV